MDINGMAKSDRDTVTSTQTIAESRKSYKEGSDPRKQKGGAVDLKSYVSQAVHKKQVEQQ